MLFLQLASINGVNEHRQSLLPPVGGLRHDVFDMVLLHVGPLGRELEMSGSLASHHKSVAIHAVSD